MLRSFHDRLHAASSPRLLRMRRCVGSMYRKEVTNYFFVTSSLLLKLVCISSQASTDSASLSIISIATELMICAGSYHDQLLELNYVHWNCHIDKIVIFVCEFLYN